MTTLATDSKWMLCFERWDRSTIINAFRNYKRFQDEVIQTMWPVFDEDQETVNASIQVNNLDDVVEVMSLIKSHERNGSGVVLHASHTFDVCKVNASLAQIKTGYEPKSASMARESTRNRNAEAYQLIVSIEQSLRTLHNLAIVRD